MIAWVTGGGTGIGRALTERLYEEGAKIVISGRRKDVLDEAAREIGSRPGGEIMAMAGDVTEKGMPEAVISVVEKRWGAIDLLVNNAGLNTYHSALETPLEEYRQSLEINCLAAIHCAELLLPSMLKAGRGAIVNISSVLGGWASANSASYSVSKYALKGYTDVLRQALVNTPVRVLGVYPGFVRTAMTLPTLEAGSFKSKLGIAPKTMAKAILGALRNGKVELYYPWYVPWVLRIHRWFPFWSDKLAVRVKR